MTFISILCKLPPLICKKEYHGQFTDIFPQLIGGIQNWLHLKMNMNNFRNKNALKNWRTIVVRRQGFNAVAGLKRLAVFRT